MLKTIFALVRVQCIRLLGISIDIGNIDNWVMKFGPIQRSVKINKAKFGPEQRSLFILGVETLYEDTTKLYKLEVLSMFTILVMKFLIYF